MDIINDLYEKYQIKINEHQPITNKTSKIICTDNNCFFIKQVSKELENKYQFLNNQGVSNILYPTLNIHKDYISNFDQTNYYVSDYVDNKRIIDDQIAYNLFNSLSYLHNSTSIKRQLSVTKARPKFEEITKQLDYKFKLLENFIRNLETRSIDKYSYVVLENYHIILKAKKELINLQKRIISAIKSKESVEYVFLHNNPKLEHLIMSRGSSYLTSIDHGKIGIDGLDLAKFYIENQHLSLDFKKIIFTDYYNHKSDFYYDYFCFLVIFIYIKRIDVINIDLISMEKFVHNAYLINDFMEKFLNKNDPS